MWLFIICVNYDFSSYCTLFYYFQMLFMVRIVQIVKKFGHVTCACGIQVTLQHDSLAWVTGSCVLQGEVILPLSPAAVEPVSD